MRSVEVLGATTDTAANQYGDVAAVYDVLMDNVPHGAWLSRIEKAVRLRNKSPRSALDIACGTGLVTHLLSRRGYRPVVGVDIAPAMIAIARTKAQATSEPVDYFVQDAAALTLTDTHGNPRTFDLVVSLFDSLNYILDPAQLQAAFCRIFDHTAPGGVFAFDLNSLYALSHNLFSQESHDGPVQHIWRAEWNREDRICKVHMAFTVRDAHTGQTRQFSEIHVQRAYTVPEVTEWLQSAGWQKIEVFGNYGERAPGPKSDRLLFVCEKP